MYSFDLDKLLLMSIAPVTWGGASEHGREEYYREMDQGFDVLRHCDNHWKPHRHDRDVKLFTMVPRPRQEVRPSVKKEWDVSGASVLVRFPSVNPLVQW